MCVSFHARSNLNAQWAGIGMEAGGLNWWQLVALLGALQGLVLAVALATRPTGRTPHRLLAGAILSFSLFLATVVYYSANLVGRFPHLFAATQPLPFLFGPLVFFYAVTASDRSRRLTWRDAWHAAPAAIVLVLSVPIFLLSGAEKVAMYEAIRRGAVPMNAMLTDPLRFLSGGGYTLATLVVLRRHRQIMADNYSSLERVNLVWVQRLVFAAGGIWLLAFGLQVSTDLGHHPGIETDLLIATAITALIYAIGYLGLRQPQIVRFDTAEHVVPVEASVPSQRYERSGLDARAAEKIQARLMALMAHERPYRRAELTLGDLATALDTTPHRLSEVLNAQLSLSFHDFVNGYRVREVQERLAGVDGARYTYLTLALDAGFASKSTFNAVFKKQTGMTPSAYRISQEG